uniref:Secreted protein n=1 Tax=Panagrellus redivivus TaxID=6233 RepID=A0A7E4VR04_PANRE
MLSMRFFSCVVAVSCLLGVMVEGGSLSDIANKVAETASSFGDTVQDAASSAGEKLMSVTGNIGSGLNDLKDQVTGEAEAAANKISALNAEVQAAVANRTSQLAAKKDVLLSGVDPTFQPVAKNILDQLQNGTSLSDIIDYVSKATSDDPSEYLSKLADLAAQNNL